MPGSQLILVIAAGGAMLVAPASATGAGSGGSNTDDNRIICRKMPETGSLVRRNKQCFTKAEWDRIAESQRAGAERLVRDLTTRSAGN